MITDPRRSLLLSRILPALGEPDFMASLGARLVARKAGINPNSNTVIVASNAVNPNTRQSA